MSVRAGESFELYFTNWDTGLVGVATISVDDGISTAGHVILAATTVGIVEDPAGSGAYTVTGTIPEGTAAGQYRAVLDNHAAGDARERLFEEIEVVEGTPAPLPIVESYTPTLAEVGALLRGRTRFNGSELGTFTSNTHPTADQVTVIINSVVGKLEAKFGNDPPDELMASARHLVALRAALFVELTFFGDQIGANRSPYPQLKQLYDDELKDFIADRANIGADGEAGTGDDLAGGGLAVFSFPPLTGPRTPRAPGAETPYDETWGLDW